MSLDLLKPAPPASGGLSHFPAFLLGDFPNYREAAEAVFRRTDVPRAFIDEWVREWEGRPASLRLRGMDGVQVIIGPAPEAAARVVYLFGDSPAPDAESAARVAADCAAGGWPEPPDTRRWFVWSGYLNTEAVQ